MRTLPIAPIMPMGVLLLVACSSTEPITGGFQEMVVDKKIVQGQGLDPFDFDGDGMMDLLIATSQTDAVHIYFNLEGAGEKWDRIAISGTGSLVAIDVEPFDVDDDGDMDVITAALTQREAEFASPGELVWYENPGDPRGIWTTRPIAVPIFNADTSSIGDWSGGHYGACCLHMSDLDGDGRDDLIVGQRGALDNRNQPVGNRIQWYRNEGPGQFTGPATIDSAISDVVSLLSTDVDGDGRRDVIASASTGQEIVWYQNLADAGGLPTFIRYQVSTVGATHGMALGNVDNDAADELVVATVYTSSTAVRYFDPPMMAIDQPWAFTDVSFIFPPVNTSTIPEQAPMPPGAPRITLADIDANGQMDIAVTTNGPDPEGEVRIYLNGGGSFDRVDVRAGYRGVVGLVSADINNDGRMDLVTSTFGFGSRDRISWWRNDDPSQGIVPDVPPAE